MVKKLVGPGGFEPPTSTMSRAIGRNKTRVDIQKLTSLAELILSYRHLECL